MEAPLYMQLLIEEVKLPSLDLSSTMLQLKIDFVTKEYQYPYRDIYFQLPHKFSSPVLKLNFLSIKTSAEGTYSIKNLKQTEKARISLFSLKEPVGHVIAKLIQLEHLNKEICNHCASVGEVIVFNSKKAKKLANFENRIIDSNLGLEIGMDFLDLKETLEPKDLSYVKNLLLGACQKMKALELYQQFSQPKSFITSSQTSSVSIDYPKIISTLEQEISHQNKTIDEMHKENKTYIELYHKEKAKYKMTMAELEALKLETNILKGEMIKIRANKRKNSCAEAIVEEAIEGKKMAEMELRKIRDLYNRTINEFAVTTKNYEESISKLSQEKEYLEGFKEKILAQNREITAQNDSLNSLTLVLKSEILEKESKIRALESINQESMAKQLIKENVAVLYQKIEGDLKRFNEFSRLMRKEKSEAMQQAMAQNEELKLLKEKIENLEGTIRASQLKADEGTVTINSLRQKLYLNKSDCDLSVEIRDITAQALEIEGNFNKQSDFLIKFVLDLSQKFLIQQRLITKMFKYIEDKDCEICILRNKILQEQNNISIYIPDKNDNIDISMADYINTRPSFLEVSFIRIEAGVYMFGMKIVKVKLQNNRLIMCMGGGFMSIDEFISIHTPLELEKMNERKKFDQAAQMKALVNDSLSFLSNESSGTINDESMLKKRLKVELSNNSLFKNSRKSSLSSPMLISPKARIGTRKNSLASK